MMITIESWLSIRARNKKRHKTILSWTRHSCDEYRSQKLNELSKWSFFVIWMQCEKCNLPSIPQLRDVFQSLTVARSSSRLVMCVLLLKGSYSVMMKGSLFCSRILWTLPFSKERKQTFNYSSFESLNTCACCFYMISIWYGEIVCIMYT